MVGLLAVVVSVVGLEPTWRLESYLRDWQRAARSATGFSAALALHLNNSPQPILDGDFQVATEDGLFRWRLRSVHPLAGETGDLIGLPDRILFVPISGGDSGRRLDVMTDSQPACAVMLRWVRQLFADPDLLPLRGRYALALAAQGGDEVTLIACPRRADERGLFVRAEVTVGRTTGLIRSIRLHRSNGDVAEFRFTDADRRPPRPLTPLTLRADLARAVFEASSPPAGRGGSAERE